MCSNEQCSECVHHILMFFLTPSSISKVDSKYQLSGMFSGVFKLYVQRTIGLKLTIYVDHVGVSIQSDCHSAGQLVYQL